LLQVWTDSPEQRDKKGGKLLVENKYSVRAPPTAVCKPFNAGSLLPDAICRTPTIAIQCPIQAPWEKTTKPGKPLQ
jgi:hypothetical protein